MRYDYVWLFFMTKKLNAVVQDEVIEELDRLAKNEQRTRSQMADILLQEAITARKIKFKGSQEEK